MAKFLEHIRWLKSLGHGLPDTREMAVTTRHQLMLEARPLDAKDIRTVKLIKRHTLAVLLIQRSEEHTSELQSLMRISYAVFCLTNNYATPDCSAPHTTTALQQKNIPPAW